MSVCATGAVDDERRTTLCLKTPAGFGLLRRELGCIELHGRCAGHRLLRSLCQRPPHDGLGPTREFPDRALRHYNPAVYRRQLQFLPADLRRCYRALVWKLFYSNSFFIIRPAFLPASRRPMRFFMVFFRAPSLSRIQSATRPRNPFDSFSLTLRLLQYCR